MNFQMKATDTEDRMVGKKNRARSRTLPREFLVSSSARISENSVCAITTSSTNFRLLVRALVKSESLVKARMKLSRPT
ncbi:hypothetical protein [Pseudarthrobacter phenanthrenivorans]|uniref:hypothetical protein n=1 Tax=Pseudarthrobacter phenanthrenivorans TaxID=361575 RepID=UPI00217D8E41|nr:hypothetical protein [Pseudarthrobacter phenanthrenivorans]